MATITVNQGDDYSTIGQGPVQWTLTGAPNLAAAAITLEITRGGAVVATAAGALVGSTYPAAQVVNVTLSDTTTDLLTQRSYAFVLRAVLSNGDEVTLDAGGPGSLYATPRMG